MTPREMIEWIQENVGEFCMTRCRDRPKLVYVASPIDVAQMRADAPIAVRGMSCDGGFNLHTAAGYVEVVGDPSSPRGGVVRMFRCRCGQLFGDDSSRSGECAGCMMTSVAATIVEQPATFTTTCARCAVPLEASDTAVKAHEERCFAIGEYVRWDNQHDASWHARDPRWFEGTIVDIYLTDPGWRAVRIRVARGSESYVAGDCVSYSNTANIRRIPRPEQTVASAQSQYAEFYRGLAAEAGSSIRIEAADPLDVEYDGKTLRTLLLAASGAARDKMTPLARSFTPAQRASVSAHWSAALRERVAASQERERMSVMIEVDAEDEPW